MFNEYESEDEFEESRYVDFCMVGPTDDLEIDDSEDSLADD